MNKIVLWFVLVLGLMGCSVSKETEQPTVTPTPILEDAYIVKEGVKIDDTGTLIYIPNEIVEENIQQSLYCLEDKFLTQYSGYDMEQAVSFLYLRMFSMETGELLSEMKMRDVFMADIQIVEENIVVCDAYHGMITVFDEQLEIKDVYQVAGDRVFVDTKLQKAYSFRRERGLYAVDLLTHEEKCMLTGSHDLNVSRFNGNEVSMQYLDAENGLYESATLDLDTGNVTILDVDESFVSVQTSHKNWLCMMAGKSGQYLMGDRDDLRKLQLQTEGHQLSLVGDIPQLLITDYSTNGKQTNTLYDLDGTFRSTVTIEEVDAGPWSDPVWSESVGGYFFLVPNEKGFDQLYFWDLSAEIPGDDLRLMPYTQEKLQPGNALPLEYYKRAEQLADNYHLTIKIADQCEMDYIDKTAERELNPEMVAAGLDMLEETLACYPDNFFEQLYYEHYRNIEINLMGRITDKENIEGHDAIAFVEPDAGAIKMVLNITRHELELPQTFHHEISHMIDGKLAFNARYHEESLYSEEKWDELNPESFIGYYEAYGILPDEYNKEEYTEYFIDTYSMTFATEDRARIFEHAASGNDVMFIPSVYEGRMKKLEYYCACIRDGFDTTGWPEKTAWELTLDSAAQGGSGKG